MFISYINFLVYGFTEFMVIYFQLLSVNNSGVWWEHIKDQYTQEYNEVLDEDWLSWSENYSDIKIEKPSSQLFILSLEVILCSNYLLILIGSVITFFTSLFDKGRER